MSPVLVGGRYALVAGACLVTHNLVMIVGDQAGIAMPLLVVLSFAIVVVLGFSLHSRFTFAVQADARSLLRYAGAMAANMPVTIALLWLFCTILHWPMAIAAPTATVLLVVANFFASQWAIVAGRERG